MLITKPKMIVNPKPRISLHIFTEQRPFSLFLPIILLTSPEIKYQAHTVALHRQDLYCNIAL
ncbi:hypothetical protein D3C77_391350 [compost metagenome]